ncbi:hypothetical protein DSLASN_42390 [Desulfoluna limicola]|uniref:Uncharacterized protein n=1 Tax=Desulfoluna limicola TaxID=2810562 RepID=A0ABM7PMB4_9BACT|nr:hypothetical protein DSLASN_42390 [Desulfoluna limicola]
MQRETETLPRAKKETTPAKKVPAHVSFSFLPTEKEKNQGRGVYVDSMSSGGVVA